MIYAFIAAAAFLVITLCLATVIYLTERKTMREALIEASGLAICIVVVLFFIACLTVDWAELIKPSIMPIRG